MPDDLSRSTCFFLEDFSDSDKTARAKLKDLLGKARQLELKSYLSYDKLLVMDAENRHNVYVYDDSSDSVKALAQAKIIKKSVILFRVLNMTI